MFGHKQFCGAPGGLHYRIDAQLPGDLRQGQIASRVWSSFGYVMRFIIDDQ